MTWFEQLMDKVDAIYILTLSSRKDRQEHIKGMLQNVLSDPLEKYDKIHFIYATPFPHNARIFKLFKMTKPNEYDCARNHYGIVRQSIDFGYNKILVIEDDIQFLSADMSELINNIPDNADVIQFGGFTTNPALKQVMVNDISKAEWIKNTQYYLWNMSMYMLSAKGMQYYIKYMDTVFTVADFPMYHAPLNHKIINTYFPNYPLVIQADKNIVSSDIRSAETDRINYNTDNIFEIFADKSLYYQYSK